MPDGLWRYGRVPEGTYTYTLNGLAPGSLYDMRLFAENAVGKSGETEIISVTTLSKSNENGMKLTIKEFRFHGDSDKEYLNG